MGRLMNRPDLGRFFGDLELVDKRWHKQLSTQTLDKLYEDALQLQIDMQRIGRGLTFGSFKVVLNNVMKQFGDSWMNLLQKQMEAYRQIEEASFRQYSTERRRSKESVKEDRGTKGAAVAASTKSPTRRNRYMDEIESHKLDAR